VGNILQTMKRRKSNCIGHISRWNSLIKHNIEGRMEGMKLREDEGKNVISYWTTLRKRELL